MTSKRRPLNRHAWRVTPMALAAWRKMLELEPDCLTEKLYTAKSPEWLEEQQIIRLAMKVPPWTFPITCDETLVAALMEALEREDAQGAQEALAWAKR